MAQQPRGPRTQVTRGALIAASAAAAIAFFAGGPVASAAILNTFFVTFATTYALGMYSAREASKAAQQEAQERRETIRSAVSPRRVIYGEVQTGGTLVYAQVTGPEKNYLHMVIALAGHEVDSIGDLFFDDKFLGEIDPATGSTTTGTYAGLVRVKKYLGTADQAADADLVAESGGRWTVNHRLRGVAYIYVRLQWNQDRFLGIPNIRAQVRGKKVLDPRTGQTAYTLNPALHLRDYFTNTAYGLGCVSGEINDTTVAAAADICDQWVALASEVQLNIATIDPTYDNITTTGGLDARVSTGDRCRFRVLTGTAPTGLVADNQYYLIRRSTDLYQLASTYDNAINGVPVNITAVPSASTYKLDTFAQHRYQCNGTFTLDSQPAAIEEPIRMTMAGSTVYSEGQWRIYAGAYSAPTTTITADELRGDISLRPRRPRRELVNQIRGTYVDPARNWVATDFPPYTDATYVAQDGGEVISRSIDLSWVINPFQAQRVAKIFMNRNRSVQMSMPCKISALRVATAESINVTIDELGYENEVFRVVGWKLNGEDGGIGIDLSLEADSAAVYDWAAGDAINPPTLVAVDVPDPRTVAAPENLQLFSGNDELLVAGDGTVISRIRVAWTAPAALNIAGYEVNWRRSSETDYTNSVLLDGRQLSYTIAPVQDGVDYDVRVRTVNSFGAKSAWFEINDYEVIGKTAPPPAPTSLTVAPAVNGFDIVWSSSGVADYAYTLLLENTTNNSATATAIARVAGNRFARAGLPSNVTRYYWVRHVDTSGNQSTIYPAATSGVSAVTLAGEGGVPTVANAAAITGAIGTEPPGGSNYWAVFDNTTGRIWAWQTGTGSYSKAVDAADIAGTLADAQIASLAASKITGQLTDAQVANVAAAKLIGQVVSTQIANVANTAIIGNIVSSQIANITGGQVIGNLTNANIPNANIIGQLVASQIANVANTAIIGNIVSSQITSVLGNQVIGNLTNANIPNANIIGQLVSSQIASVANTAIVGTLTDSQLANIAATKLIGNIVASQIANVANTAIIGNIVSSQITSITGGQVIGNLTNANIPNANIIGQLVSSQIANVANTAIIGNIVDSQLSTITASKVLGNLTAANIPNTRIIGQLVSSQIANVANTAIIGNIVDSQLASITASKVLGNLTAANIPNANIIGNIIASQITSVANTQITGTLTDSQLANIAAAKLTGQITTTQITDNAITTPKILAGAVVANSIAAGAVVAEKIATDAVTADKILANAVVAGKIAANAVVAVSIAANAVTSDKIVTNTINASHIVAGAITSDKIAANAVVANAIAAGVITSDKIAANTIAGDRLLANTITAAQIATGAITADELAANSVTATAILANAVTTAKLAAGSVTTNKLVVVGNAEALNDDPNTQDITAWSTTPANSATITTDTTAPSGNQVLRVSATGPTVISARAIPIDPSKNYQLRLWTRSSTGSTTTYLTVAFYDVNGALISGGATGWLSQGTFHYWGLAAQTVPSTWTEYRVSFGGTEPITMPAGARFVRVGFLGNWAGTGVQDVTGIKLILKSDADLIVDGAIVAAKIAANAIVAGKIAASSITSTEIAANAIGATQIAANAVTADKILANAVTAGKIAANAVTANEIAAGTITGDKIAANTIGADRLVANSITANQIATGAITADELAVNSVTANAIAAGSVTTAKIAANAVTANEILAGSITTAKIAANAVTANVIAAGAVGATQIAADAITANAILAGSVTTAKIAANAVTANEIAASTITGSKIAANTILGSSIIAGNITATQIATGAITSDKIAANAVTANAILAGSVTAAAIAANAVTANAIAAATITGDKIAANTIGADRLVANSITATQIQAGAIGASQLAAGSVTANAIAANAVVAGDIAANAVTAETIAANAVTAVAIAAGTITGNKIAANTILGSSIVAGNITGDRIAANTITGNLIQAGSITADRLSVANLAAITANLGSVTSGNFTTDTTGFIRSGTATWSSGTGFWMGYDATTYKFRVGDPTANQMSWDGTNLSVTGQITDRRQHGAGSNTFASADFPLFIGNAGTTAANLYKSIRVSRPGTITVYFELRAGGQSIAYGQIRRNGVAVGTLRSTPTGPVGQLGPVQSWSENITVSAGDLVQLYCSYSGTNTGVCKNFKLRTNLTIATDGVEQDDGGFNYAWGA